MGHLRRIADIQPFAELAQGSATVVYKGYQASLSRFVLLKVLRPQLAYDEALVDRFEREARLAAQIQHPNVVAIYTHGTDGDLPYLAAEFIEGTDMRALLAEHGPLPADLALFVVSEAAKGLRAAHQKGVLHRDLKPANMLVAQDGQVKLTDFGLASLRDDLDEEVRGTWGYLAPETVRGEAPTEAADLFALGATFFEILTARPAFSGDSTSAVLDALLHHDPLEMMERWVHLPPALKDLLGRLLAKDPAARFPDTQALIEAIATQQHNFGLTTNAATLETYLSAPDEYRPAPLDARLPEASTPNAPPLRRPLPRSAGRPAIYYVAAAFLAILAVGTGFMLWNGNASRPPSENTAPAFSETPVPVGTPNEIQPTDLASDTTVAASAEAVPSDASLSTSSETTVRDTTVEDVGSDLPAPDSALVIQPVEEPTSTPPSSTGQLALEVSPWADVLLDQVPQGRTPLDTLFDLAPGSHTLTLQHPQFPPFTTTINVEAGETLSRTISLWDEVAQITLVVSPWAHVYLDGTLHDTTPLTHPLLIPPGTHHLRLENPALGQWDTTFAVVRGEKSTLRLNLHRRLAQ